VVEAFMASAQVSDIIRLGSFLIPVLILLLASQAVRFDPNRRLARPSVVRASIKKYQQPWGAVLALIRFALVAILLLDVTEIVLASLHAHDVLALLPAWAIFRNPTGSAMYAMLALLAVWFVAYLRRMSIDIFDQVFASHLDFADWRTAGASENGRPALHPGTWRYQMKWAFKTNPEPIDALHMRLILDCPTFGEFERRIQAGEYPPSFKSVLEDSPYGWIIGDTAKLMRDDVRQGLYRAASLWSIWEGRPHPSVPNAVIDSKDAMAAMLYGEIRGLLVCTTCQAHPQRIQACEGCQGTGARMTHCPDCQGSGLGATAAACKQCGGLGLHHRPIPGPFMDRLQYLWMARNVDLMKRLFPLWLSNRTYLAVVALTAALFFGVSLVFQAGANVDLLAQALLFGEAVLLGMLSGAIVFVFASAFNGSGMLISSYPLRDTKFGNRVWTQLMNLLGVLTFGSLLIDTTFVMSQFLFVHNANAALLGLATVTVTMFVILISFGGFYTIHTAMRDAKRSRLDELADWLHQTRDAQSRLATAQEEEFFKEIRQLQEWPIDLATTFGIVSGILIPIALALGGPISSLLSSLLHTL
jgi:hypothetical protein